MKLSLHLILFLLAAVIITVPRNLYGQTGQKYLIYFKDKGVDDRLYKVSAAYQDAIKSLSQTAIERRKKTIDGDIINYDDLPVDRYYISELGNYGIQIIHRLDWFNAVSAYLTASQLEQIKSLPFISKIETVKKPGLKGMPEGTNGAIFKAAQASTLNYGQSYYQLALSDVTAVHSAGITGAGVKVGILDTGFDWKTHESLKARTVLAEHDFIFNDDNTANEANDAISQHNHGTYVFSILGSYKDSLMIGAAYGASFLLAKTEDVRSEKHIEEDNYAAALQWMENQGVDITSSSLGYNTFDAGETSYTYENLDGKTTIITKAAELAFQRGVLTLSAAGNEGDDPWFHILAPADGFNTIAVGAVSNEDSVALFSSRGPTADGRFKPDVVAQGVYVFGARAGTVSSYQASNGTSAATPIASGVAALLLSAHPHLTNVQLRSILIQSANNYLKPNNIRGYGLLSAKKAIEYPNIEKSGSAYIIHKMFVDTINTAAPVYAHFIVNNVTDSVKLSSSGAGLYTGTVPAYSQNRYVKMKLTYTDNAGARKTYPANGLLYFNYGSTVFEVYKEPAVLFGFEIPQNYPNPFTGGTTISINSAYKDDAILEIYDLLGSRVKCLHSGVVSSGINRFSWDGKNDKGEKLAAGVYFLSARMNKEIKSYKMLLLR